MSEQLKPEFKNNKLRGRITELYDTQESFADAIGKARMWVNQRLTGTVEMSRSDIHLMASALEIPQDEIGVYFFTL